MNTVDEGLARDLVFEVAGFSRLRDGLLAHHTVVLNILDLARQIGAVTKPGTPGARVGLWLQHVAAQRTRARLHGSPHSGNAGGLTRRGRGLGA